MRGRQCLKRMILICLVISVPFILGTQVWQVSRFMKLKEDIAVLEKEQQEWLEKNKKVLAGISLFNSPERIERLAQEELDLERIDSRRVLKIVLPGSKGF